MKIIFLIWVLLFGQKKQVPVEEQIEALDWLHSQDQNVLPRCYFSGRSRVTISDFSSTDITNLNGSGNLKHISTSADDNELVSVAGVGSAVLFRSPNPFSFDDWLSIKRYCIQFLHRMESFWCSSYDSVTRSFQFLAFP